VSYTHDDGGVWDLVNIPNTPVFELRKDGVTLATFKTRIELYELLNFLRNSVR
jgi:hypothetical protein